MKHINLTRRIDRLAAALPDQTERLIAHLPDWQKLQLAMASAKASLYRKLELLCQSPELAPEDRAAKIAAIEAEIEREQSPEERAASSWYARTHPGEYSGAKELLLQRLERIRLARSEHNECSNA